jgi:uncharacterized protein (DUF1015 family)
VTKPFIDTVPNEIIKLQDETIYVKNFEVDFGEEEEELTYAGGIKGIRALRV